VTSTYELDLVKVKGQNYTHTHTPDRLLLHSHYSRREENRRRRFIILQ